MTCFCLLSRQVEASQLAADITRSLSPGLHWEHYEMTTSIGVVGHGHRCAFRPYLCPLSLLYFPLIEESSVSGRTMPRASIFVAAGGTSANGKREEGNESPTELFLEEEGQFLHSR